MWQDKDWALCSSWIIQGDKNDSLCRLFLLLLLVFPSFSLLLLDPFPFLSFPPFHLGSQVISVFVLFPAESVKHVLGHPCQLLTQGSDGNMLVVVFHGWSRTHLCEEQCRNSWCYLGTGVGLNNFPKSFLALTSDLLSTTVRTWAYSSVPSGSTLLCFGICFVSWCHTHELCSTQLPLCKDLVCCNGTWGQAVSRESQNWQPLMSMTPRGL